MKNPLQYGYFFLLSMGLTMGELSRKVIPTHYDVIMTIDSLQRTLEGNVCIEIYCEDDVTEIKLNAKEKHGIKIREKIEIMEISGQNHEQYMPNFENKDENDEVSTLRVSLLKGKRKYKLRIPFTGVIDEENGYIIYSENQFIIATNFLKQGAFPCFDEPFLLSTFKLALHVKKGETVFSNSPGRRNEYEDEVAFVFDENTKLTPSQISFVVTNIPEDYFMFYEHSFSLFQWQPKFWYRIFVENKLDLKKKLKGVTKSLGYMGRWFSYPSVTFLVIPTDREIVSPKFGLCLISEKTIAHAGHDEMVYNIFLGLSSQWIGGMVSPDSWDSNWMFTALASYVAYLEMGKDTIMEDIPINSLQGQPFSLDYTIQNNIDPFLDMEVGHTKGLMLLRMIHHALGRSAFVDAIDDFIKKYQYSSVGLDGLYESFDGRSSVWLKWSVLPDGATWGKVMKTWEKKGYPLVSVRYDGSRFKVFQQSILVGQPYRSSVPMIHPGEDKWHFPLTYTYSNNPEFKANRALPAQWIYFGRPEVSSGNKKNVWMIVNLNYIGLYRVTYDYYSLQLLIKALDKNIDSIPTRIRAQLVMDSLALSWLGKQTYKVTFSLLQYLKKETDTIVWKVFFRAATNLKEILENTELFNDFKVFFKQILPNAFFLYYQKQQKLLEADKDGFAEEIGMSSLDIEFHYWACILASSQNCRLKMLKEYEEWISNFDDIKSYGNTHMTDKDVSSLAMCVGLTAFNNKNFQTNYPELSLRPKRLSFFINALLNEDMTSNIRELFINAISCVNDESTLNSFIEWSTTSKYDKTTMDQKKKGFLELIKGDYSYLPLLNYFFENIGSIQSFYQSVDTLALFVYNFTSRIKKEDLLNKMEDFVKNTPQLKKEKIFNEFERGKTLSKLKITWLKNNERQLKESESESESEYFIP